MKKLFIYIYKWIFGFFFLVYEKNNAQKHCKFIVKVNKAQK